MLAGLVVVVDQRDVVGEAAQGTRLVNAERRARTGHHVLNATLVHGNHVGLTFHYKHAVFLHHGLLGQMDAVELAFFLIDGRSRRVDIFLLNALGGLVQLAGIEADNLSAQVKPREHHTSGKTVDEFTVALALIAQSHAHAGIRILKKIFLLITLLQQQRRQGLGLGQVVAQTELTDDIVTETAAAEILHANGHSVHIVVKRVLEITGRPLVHNEHRLAIVLCLALLVRQFALLNLNMVFIGKPTQRLWIGHLLVFHDEVHGVATLAASETAAGVA